MPNLTIGPLVCEALRKHGVTAPIDVHLMVSPVDRLITDFAKAGASYITFHPEASDHIDRSLQLVRDAGCKSGLVFNPATPLSYLDHVLDKIDMVLLMSVNPGFGGQAFIESSLDKLAAARKILALITERIIFNYTEINDYDHLRISSNLISGLINENGKFIIPKSTNGKEWLEFEKNYRNFLL